MNSCPFCDRDKIRAENIRDIDDHWVFEPLNPVTPGHTLVVPKAHAKDLTKDIAQYGKTSVLVARLAREIGPCNIITSKGAEATQTVLHMHVHIVPRSEGDGLMLPWTNQYT